MISGEVVADTTESNPNTVNTASDDNSSYMTEHLLDSDNDDSLNLQEILEELSPTVTPMRNAYFKVKACEDSKSTTLLMEVNVQKEAQIQHSGYLYFFPDLDQYFILEVNEGRTRNGKKQLELWNQGSNRVTITENQVLQSSTDRTRSLDKQDVLSCLGTTLGIKLDFKDITTGFMSLACTSLKLHVLYQTVLHCFSMVGVGVNNVTSTLGCIGGIARYVSCGYVNCTQLDSKIAQETNGTSDFCALNFPCLAGQGNCEQGQCQSGLVCRQNVGANYGFSPDTNVCEVSSGSSGGHPRRQNGSISFCTSNYPCASGQGDCDILTGQNQCQAGLICKLNVGANYGFSSGTDVCEVPAPNASDSSSGGHPNRKNGSSSFCTSKYPCALGQGDCDILRGQNQCQAGLICKLDVGANYGFSRLTDVCEAP